MKMKTWIFSFLFCVAFCDVYAQSLSATVSSDSILFGNVFILEVSLEDVNEDIPSISFTDFDIISGPNMSTSMSIINGQTQSSKSLSYYLKPKDLGSYFIEPIFLEVDGETLETKPIEINVYPNPDGLIIEPQKNTMDDFFNLKMPPIFGQDQPMKKEEAQPKKKYPNRVLKKG